MRDIDPFAYINRAYGLTVSRGDRVEYHGDLAKGAQPGVIVGADGQYLLIKLDGAKRSLPYHPTWELRYLTEARNA